MSRYITIITTVYNIAPYLERFFKCLGEQTFTDYEALIVDAFANAICCLARRRRLL